MMAHPIVVGVDGSLESAAAAAAGVQLAEAAGVPCHLLHATHDVRFELDLAGSGVDVDALQEAMQARVHGELISALAQHVPSDILVGLRIRTGRPGTVLAALVDEVDAGLVVLGGKHHSTLGRWLVGSTAHSAVRQLSVPILVTAGDLQPRPRVLVAVDLSYAALATVHGAVEFARLSRGPLRALHVIEPPFDEARAREWIERDVWTLLPIPDHEKVMRRGRALDTIAEEAAAWHADVIVVGAHGKGWMDRLLIGSMTEDLLSNLPGAVLVIPVPAPTERQARPVLAPAAAMPA